MAKKLFEKAKESKPKKAKKEKEVLLLPEIAATSIITVDDKQDRNVLSEGRSYQMGFAFCKKVEEGKFETVQPISPCKDYLNDVLYSENTGKPLSACGLKTKKQDIFDGKTSYLAIKICPRKGNNDAYKTLEEDRTRLAKNISNVQTLLNYIEEKLGVVGRTDIKQASNDKDMFLLYVPYWWCQTTHLISLYSLAVRVGQFWDGTGTPDQFMETYNNPLDTSLWKPSYGTGGFMQYKRMLKYGVHLITPEEMCSKWETSQHSAIHSQGILTY